MIHISQRVDGMFAVEESEKLPQDVSSSKPDGYNIIQLLFKFGASCLER